MSSHTAQASGIRSAGLDDLAKLKALKEDVIDASWGPGFPATALDAWKGRFVSETYFLERLVPSPDRPPTRFFLAGPPDAPWGMVALKLRDGCAYIGDLYVRARGRGIGRQLLEHSEAEARDLGVDVAVADVFDGNWPAYQLLVSDGFREVGEYTESSLGIRVLRLSRALLT